jgi:hypothetical protein
MLLVTDPDKSIQPVVSMFFHIRVSLEICLPCKLFSITKLGDKQSLAETKKLRFDIAQSIYKYESIEPSENEKANRE